MRGAARKAKRKRSLFPSLRPLLYPLPNGEVTTNFAICNLQFWDRVSTASGSDRIGLDRLNKQLRSPF